MSEPERLGLEYVALSTLRRWPRNPKAHDLGAIAASIAEFGMRDPVGVERTTHQIEEGNGRLDALMAMKAQGRRAPRFVAVDAQGEWYVPVLYFDDDATTAERYLLAHNRTQELGGGYDEAILARVLADVAVAQGLAGTGWDGEDVDALLRRIDARAEVEPPEVVFAEELDEQSNYLVLYFRTTTDWLHVCTVLGLHGQYAARRNGKPWSKGLGRVVDGPSALARLRAVPE